MKKSKCVQLPSYPCFIRVPSVAQNSSHGAKNCSNSSTEKTKIGRSYDQVSVLETGAGCAQGHLPTHLRFLGFLCVSVPLWFNSELSALACARRVGWPAVNPASER